MEELDNTSSPQSAPNSAHESVLTVYSNTDDQVAAISSATTGLNGVLEYPRRTPRESDFTYRSWWPPRLLHCANLPLVASGASPGFARVLRPCRALLG